MSFSPIAIIGRSCLLPGANTPLQLWKNVLEGKDCLTDVPKDYWKIEPYEVSNKKSEEFTDTQRGGYIEAFSSIFNPELFGDDAAMIRQQDVICQWLLHVGSEALQDAGYSLSQMTQKKAGVIVGNLSYPTMGLSEYAQAVWLTEHCRALLDEETHQKLLIKKQSPVHRFMSGYPVHFMAKMLQLQGNRLCH